MIPIKIRGDKMKKQAWIVLVLSGLLMLAIAGCGGDKGSAECLVSFSDIPEEIYQFYGGKLDSFEVKVTLRERTSNKTNTFQLDSNNDFSTVIHLNPGPYSVSVSHTDLSNILDLTSLDAIVLTIDNIGEIKVGVSNVEEFKDWVSTMEDVSLIRDVDKFSRRILLNGKLISLENILDELEFPVEDNVLPYSEATVYNQNYGIRVTVLNVDSKLPRSSDQCKITAVRVSGNYVNFGGGLQLGMSASDVCHAETGLYGIPDGMDGSIFWGMGLGDSSAVYTDSESGDKIRLEFNESG